MPAGSLRGICVLLFLISLGSLGNWPALLEPGQIQSLQTKSSFSNTVSFWRISNAFYFKLYFIMISPFL